MAKKKAPKKPKTKTLKGVPAPKAITDSVELADWLELKALSSRDGNASKSDLSGLLRRAGGYDPANDADAVERLCLAAFTELETRPKSSGDFYPFVIKGGVVRVKLNALTKYPVYIFCLCLSAWRWMNAKERPDNARQLFEDVSCFVAKNYLGGEVLRFASPRVEALKEFSTAIGHLCQVVGEGAGFREDQAHGSKKDAKLDVVAWKGFPDTRFGKVVLFGQCASGGDWMTKRAELQPAVFIGQWIQPDFTVDCVRAFFVPHRMRADVWKETTRMAGIPFDRCRVSYWAHQDGPLPKRQELIAWSKHVIPRQ